MSLFVFPPQTINTTGLATEPKQDDIITELQDVNSELDSQSTTLTSIDTKVSTAANQVTAQTSLSNIESDLNDLNARLAGNLVPETFDYMSLTYVAAGNGAGEIETVTYNTGGAGGTTVATLTLTYDANNNVSTITRS